MKNIYIFFEEGNLVNNPSLNCFIKDLSKKNNLKIFCNQNKFNGNFDNTKFYFKSKLFNKISNIIYNKICYYNLALFYFIISRYYILFHDIDLVIGIDRIGLIEGYFISKLKKKPLVYISFEIFFQEETSKKFKDLEKKTSKLVKLFIVQDKKRKKNLSYENDLKDNKVFILPLASSSIKIKKNYNGFLEKKLNIKDNSKILAMIGSCVKWTMIDEVLANMSNWPKNWVLLIHDRYPNFEYFEHLKKKHNLVHSDKVIFSKLKIINIDEMNILLDKVNLGLALYKPSYDSMYTGKNLEYIGQASGKISTFLRYNIPVISNVLSNYSNGNDLKIGYNINDINEIPNILKRYRIENFNNEPKKYFDNFLSYDLYRHNLIKEINKLI
jgi:hypothetical protein